ncbi:MAG: SMC-Scp complex subunit ScpB [Candidatus Thalassarchaeaceae archaeon]|jgi:segregation and condensation protein B|nr:SMC-Scp complex subunit ScpB [Candidatus Thalassarchaeaceae archaeon]
MNDPELQTLLESTLFAAGHSLSVDELSEAFEVTPGTIIASLEALQSTMKRRRGGALQLTDVSGRWVMEVKPKLATHIPSSFRTEIPKRLLAPVALIAYHQPMAQSQLVDMVGQRAYDHVRELANLGLVDRRRDGLTRRLTTTRRFAEYFGCPFAESRKVRKWFREEAANAGLTGAELAAALGGSESGDIQEAPEVPVSDDWDESSAEIIEDDEE